MPKRKEKDAAAAMAEPSSVDDWLADFSITESDLQIAAYPSLFPIVHHTGVIDPFLSAPPVAVIDPSASVSASSGGGGSGGGVPKAGSSTPKHGRSKAGAATPGPGAAGGSASATPALLGFPSTPFLGGGLPPGYLGRAPNAQQPPYGLPPGPDVRQLQRGDSHHANGALAGTAAPHDARGGPAGAYTPAIDPFAQLPPSAVPAAVAQGMNKVLLPSKQQSIMMMEAERLMKPPEVFDPEQDKKERNCAASARFRKKKREQYLAMERKALDMEQRYEAVMARKEALRTEREYLQKLLASLENQAQGGGQENGIALQSQVSLASL